MQKCLANRHVNALNFVKIVNVSSSGVDGGIVEANLVKLKVSHVDNPVGFEIVCSLCYCHPTINLEFRRLTNGLSILRGHS
jgi:hypothetical protein